MAVDFSRLARWTFALVALVSATILQAAEPTLGELIAAAKSGALPARVAALEQIGAQGARAGAAVDALSGLLTDSSAEIRAYSIRALGQIGAAAKPAAPKIAELLKDENEAVRRQTVSALSSIRPGPEVMVPLVVKMLEESDAGVRIRIMAAVSDAGPAAVPSLVQALKDDKAAYWACLILRDMGAAGKDAVGPLAERLKDKRPEVRREAALALGAMQQAAAESLPQLAAALDDPDTRVAATFALGQIGRIPPSATAKIQAAAKGDDKMLSTVSYWTLARANPQDKQLHREAAERLVATLNDKDEFVRVAAARSLAAMPSAPDIMVPIFEKFLASADETTLHHALDALAALGSAAVPRLIDMLKYESLRPSIVYILGQNGPAAAPATDALAKLVSSDDAHLATSAALALANIGPAARGAVPALVAVLGNPDGAGDHAVIFALGKIGNPAAAAEPKLWEATKSTDASMSIEAAWALAQILPRTPQNMAKIVPVLVAGLSDAHRENRLAAAEALGSFGPAAKEALPALQKASSDSDGSVADAAATATRAVSAAPPK